MEDIKPGYTRVSEILSQWDRFGHIDKEVLQRKAQIGTNVHKAIEDHHNDMCPILEKAEEGYFESYKKWFESTNPQILNLEKRFYSDSMMITGQVDAIIRFPHSEDSILVDFKTSASESPKIWPLQAGFYRMLAEENNLVLSDRLIFLRLKRDGQAAHVHEYVYSKSLHRICISALVCYRHLNG